MKLYAVIILCGLFVLSVNGGRILGVLHVPTQSHQILGATILKGLADKGHDVTIASSFPLKDKNPNYRHIYLDGVIDILDEERSEWLKMSNSSLVTMFVKFSNFSNGLAHATLRSPGMQKLMNSGEKFDLVIIEPFGNEAFFGFSHLFNAQIAVLCTSLSSAVNAMAGNVAPYAFVPNAMTLLTDRMSFLERIQNTFSNLFFEVYFIFYVRPYQSMLYETYFKSPTSFDDIIKTGSLFLVNSHVVFETPRPYLPNMIQISSVHIKEPKKLPNDIQQFMDNAKDGVILFSLGSNLQSKHLPLEKRNAILNAFAKLPQKILWKFEDENLPNQPKNVKISKWLPQSDILAHPNLKLFITHGGLLSSTEAVYYGVPILGIPFYGDQHTNTERFVAAGHGEKVTFENLSDETFSEALKKLLNNPKYREKIKKTSAILRDQETKPLDHAIFWIEHVIKHGGDHLRSTANELPLYKYLLLDIVAFFATITGIIVYSIYFIIKKLCCSSKSKQDTKTKKSKSKRE